MSRDTAKLVLVTIFVLGFVLARTDTKVGEWLRTSSCWVLH